MSDLFGFNVADVLAQSIGSRFLPATLNKKTQGARATSTSGPVETTKAHETRGYTSNYDENLRGGTLVKEGDVRVVLLASELMVIPEPNDTIDIEGETHYIIGVVTDSAKATYICQCRRS